MHPALKHLERYVVKEEFRGYDPYDTLNSWVPFHWLGKWGPVLATQVQKRNPINIRPLLGIKKGINPKGFGLFLCAYSLLYRTYGKKEHLEKADYFYNWLKENQSQGFPGCSWGYNFSWASPQKQIPPYFPSSVVTGAVVKGLFAYYEVTQNPEVITLIEGAAEFMDKALAKYEDEDGLSISYTPAKADICYNASLLAAETMAKCYQLNGNEQYREMAIRCGDFVIAHQHKDGRWNYNLDVRTGKEQKQVDFHQGYIIESLFEIKNAVGHNDEKWENAIQRGIDFYFDEQWHESGRSFWRLPKKYPVEIHNQSQGIITLALLSEYRKNSKEAMRTIAEWTIENMQDKQGFFWYRIFKSHTNKIPFMRWSQAWMFLALTHYSIIIEKAE
jgi:hypothetical protein